MEVEGADKNGWASAFQSELGLVQPPSAQSWAGSQARSSGLIVKRTIRVDIPVGKYPTTDETQDFLKQQQLRELAMLNGSLHEESRFAHGRLRVPLPQQPWHEESKDKGAGKP